MTIINYSASIGNVRIALSELALPNHLFFTRRKAMKVLVIDDAQWNQDSAHQTLADHEVTVVSTVEDAFRIFHSGEKDFDAVLTDLWMPAPAKEWDAGCNRIFGGNPYHPEDDEHAQGDQIPAGLAFALAAAKGGAAHIAILTDSDHHRDRLVALLDMIGHCGRVSSREVRYFPMRNQCVRRSSGEVLKCDEAWELVHADPKEYGYVKNWGKLLQEITDTCY